VCIVRHRGVCFLGFQISNGTNCAHFFFLNVKFSTAWSDDWQIKGMGKHQQIPLIRILSVFATIGLALIGCDKAEQKPVILMDAAHHNIIPPNHASLVQYLESDGYRVDELHNPFTLSMLSGVDVVILKAPLSSRNALPEDFTLEEFNRAWSKPTPSAFSDSEIEILNRWVTDGGSLLLVFDHFPLPGCSADLAAAFGIKVSNGYAADSRKLTDRTNQSVAIAGEIVFYRGEGTLADHPITNGRDPSERIDSVATWVGSAFQIPPNGEPLLSLKSSFVSLLPDTAWVFSDSTELEDIGGWAQGAVLKVGKGRVAVFAELGVLVSKEIVEENNEKGESNPQIQNPQFLLNVLRWLSGLLN